MEMTREQLEQYRSNMEEIKELTYKLEHLGEGDGLIGNDVVFDYRTGYPKPQSVVGYDYELEARRRERLENLRAKIQAECDNVEDFVYGIPDGRTRRIFQLYFLEGLSMEKVAKKVHLDKSNVSRKITDFLQIATHATKTTL
ncbi:MAG: hypothetical protein ACLU6W_05270 [Lachnospiraceae bacterium]